MEPSDAIKGRTGNLQDKRILVTQAGEFMGPVLCEVLAEHGTEVLAGPVFPRCGKRAVRQRRGEFRRFRQVPSGATNHFPW